MDTHMSLDRRRFLGGIVTAGAATRLGMMAFSEGNTQAAGAGHRLVSGGIGHNLPQEAPKAFADAILEVAGN